MSKRVEVDEYGVRVSPARRKFWLWAIVLFPFGLLVSVIIALTLKVTKTQEDGMGIYGFKAAALNTKGLANAAYKIDHDVGLRDFEEGAMQPGMTRMTAFIRGLLSSVNLGYEIQRSEGEAIGGLIWPSYWVDWESDGSKGAVVVIVRYDREEDSAAVAASLALAEWVRGRTFKRDIRFVYLRSEQDLLAVTAGLGKREDIRLLRLARLGYGREQLVQIKGEPGQFAEVVELRGEGEAQIRSSADWTLTTAWDSYESQVVGFTSLLGELANRP